MFEGTKVVVKKLENGFAIVTQHAVDSDGAQEREYAYPHFLSLVDGLREVFGIRAPFPAPQLEVKIDGSGIEKALAEGIDKIKASIKEATEKKSPARKR